VYRTEIRIRQYKNCYIPQIYAMYRLLRGVSSVNEKNVRIGGTVVIRGYPGRAVPTASRKKICWDFVHALFELAIWLQAGEDRAIAAGSQADLKTGCRRLLIG
jgi:hypothetical protein